MQLEGVGSYTVIANGGDNMDVGIGIRQHKHVRKTLQKVRHSPHEWNELGGMKSDHMEGLATGR